MNDIFCSLMKNNSLNIILENEFFICIKDLNPQDNTHLLIISKQHFVSFLSNEFELIHNMFFLFVNLVIKHHNLTRAQLILNAAFKQEVFHFHAHIRSDE